MQGCRPLQHEHFFAADGLFGSRDANGEHVDDGVYELFDDRTVIINDIFFTFTITDGDTLRLEPVVPDCVVNGCFAAQWAVSFAYPWPHLETNLPAALTPACPAAVNAPMALSVVRA